MQVLAAAAVAAVVAIAVAVAEHQEESIAPPCSQEERDGEVRAQVICNCELSITVRVLIPEACSHMLCKNKCKP